MRPTLQKSLALFFILSLSFLGCGGVGGGSSGGGKDPLQAALVTIDVDPANIKIGDRTLVTVELQNIDENGVFMKLRYTHSLEYIVDTATLIVADEAVDMGPVEGPIENKNYTYLTFYIPKESFGEEDFGTFTMQLRAIAIDDQGAVQIDVDLHDPTKDPSEEFDSNAPLFGSEDSAEVEINRD